MVNKRFAILYICIEILICMCFFTSCRTFRSKELSKTKNEQEILEQKANFIIKAFEENDLTLLDTILSSKALDSQDLEEGFAYSYELLGNEIVEIVQKGCPVETHYDSGKSSKKADASFNITTKSGKKVNLYFEYWYSNKFDETLIGVNRIKFANLEEDYKSGRFYKQSGIYNPKWDIE